MIEKLRVVIADDHPGVRRGLRALLEKLPGLIVIGEAKNGKEALELVERVSPDVLILDIQMPVLDGVGVLERLSRSKVEAAIVVLTAIDDPLFSEELLSMGACHYVAKGDVSGLIQAIQLAKEGECRDRGDDDDWPQSKPPPRNLARVY